MRRWAIHTSALLAAAALAGCGDTLNCTASVEPALVVVVVDSLDGSAQAADATARATEGAFSEALTPYAHDDTGALVSLAGPSERAGTYSLTVDKTGYAQWRRTGIRVTAGVCHVRTVTLTARLQRTSGAARTAP